MNNYLSIINAIVHKYNINIENSKKSLVYKLLSKYIDVLIFNVVSIIAIITMINNSNTIHAESIKLLKIYINETCNKSKISGGTTLPSEYFGIDSGIYSENNISRDILDINFNSGILRPQIGGGGNIRKLTKVEIKYIADNIRQIMYYYKLKISNDLIYELINIINDNIECLFRQLKNISLKPLNPQLIKKMIKSNKHLEIFK